MIPAPLIVVFLALGVLIGTLLGIAIGRQDTAKQFHKDCVAMVHGKIDGNICERNGKILFHK